MNKKIKVTSNKAKVLNEKLQKYQTLNTQVKNVLGGVGIGTSGVGFSRLSGFVAEDAQQL